MSEIELRRYRAEEIGRLTEEAGSGGDARLFRGDDGTWWALESGGDWKRYDGSSWQPAERPSIPLEGIASPRSGDALPPEQASTLEEITAAVARVIAGYRDGTLTSTAADERLGALTVKDEKDREWAYGAKTGAWFAFDGTRWLDMPIEPSMVGTTTRVPPPEPVAPTWDPPLPPGAPRPVVIEPVPTTISLSPEEPVPAATAATSARPPVEPATPARSPKADKPHPQPEAPPPAQPPPSEQEPPAEIRRYDENEVLKIEGVVAASSRTERRYFRDDEGRWWSLSERGRLWHRFDGTTWTIGRAPRTALTGPAVDHTLGTKTEVADWAAPPPPGTMPAPSSVRADEPRLVAPVQPLPEEEQAAATPKRKTEIKRSPGGIRRSGPGLAVLFGGIALIASAFLQWAHGSLGNQTGFDVSFGYLTEGGLDVTGSGLSVGVIVVILGSLAVVLSLVRGAELFTRSLGALGLVTASLYLAQISRTVNTIRGSRIGGEEITDLLSYAPLLVILASLMILIGRPGAPKL